MISQARIEEMKKAVDDVLTDAAILRSNLWLAHALKDAVAEVEELQRGILRLDVVAHAAVPKCPAPPCSVCRDDRHEECGGPESGCGCAARGHE